MFKNGKSIFNNAFKSTCEEELNSLTQEIEWAFKKRRQESQDEIAKLKSALSEYKNKYDNCRAKQKQLLKRHEALKSHYSKLDQNYQEQLASLQEEVCELKSSFQAMLMTDKKLQEEKDTAKNQTNAEEIAKLREEAKRWSTLVEELRSQNRAQDQKQKELQATVQRLKSRLKLKEQAAEREPERPTKLPVVDTSSRLAEQAQERFLREEAAFQERFRGNLVAKLDRLQAKMTV